MLIRPIGGIRILARYDISDEMTEINRSIGDGAFKSSRVLITGGAGFLGTWLCHVLIGQGAEVTCLDNLSSGLRENIANLENNPRFTFIQHDISIPINIMPDVRTVKDFALQIQKLNGDD